MGPSQPAKAAAHANRVRSASFGPREGRSEESGARGPSMLRLTTLPQRGLPGGHRDFAVSRGELEQVGGGEGSGEAGGEGDALEAGGAASAWLLP